MTGSEPRTAEPDRPSRVREFLRAEVRHLRTFHATDRPWAMPLAAALASGLPLLVGAHFGQIGSGLVASLGGLVFLYLPDTPMHHRMVVLMTCAFGMTTSYTLGVLSHPLPAAMTPVLALIAFLVTMTSRYYAAPPPGGFFFIMAASIGAYTPADPAGVPRLVGLFSMGTLLGCGIGFLYSLHVLRYRAPEPVAPLPRATFDSVVFDSAVIGACVGLSLLLAQLLRLEKAYWVPVSCLAVIQGSSLRAIWTKQLHRVLGTAAGLVVAGAIFLLPLDPWGVAAAVIALTFVIESLVVRHYALAALFITPLTLLLADAAAAVHGSPGPLMRARLLDTVLGCLVGLAGGAAIHSPRFRAAVGGPMRRLVPTRIRRRDADDAPRRDRPPL